MIKKGVDEFGHKKKKMVLDFKKINKIKNVSDEYPIPHYFFNIGKHG